MPFEEWAVRSPLGWRTWMADDAEHAREQHRDAFPEGTDDFEPILEVRPARELLDSEYPWKE